MILAFRSLEMIIRLRKIVHVDDEEIAPLLDELDGIRARAPAYPLTDCLMSWMRATFQGIQTKSPVTMLASTQFPDAATLHGSGQRLILRSCGTVISVDPRNQRVCMYWPSEISRDPDRRPILSFTVTRGSSSGIHTEPDFAAQSSWSTSQLLAEILGGSRP